MIRSIRVDPPFNLLEMAIFTVCIAVIATAMCYMAMDGVYSEPSNITGLNIPASCLNGNTVRRDTPICNRWAMMIIKKANKGESNK